MKAGEKVMSGRWIWCVVGAFVFAFLSCMQILPMDDVKMILAIIVTFYFTKPKEKGEPTGGGL